MNRPRIFADFHNADKEGRLRLNCAGTLDDLERCSVQLEEGMQILLYSEELEVDGQVEFSDAEKVWVANIDWDAIRGVATNANKPETREGGQMPCVTIPLPTEFNASQTDFSNSPGG